MTKKYTDPIMTEIPLAILYIPFGYFLIRVYICYVLFQHNYNSQGEKTGDFETEQDRLSNQNKGKKNGCRFFLEHVKLGINLEYYYYCSLTLAFLQFPETVELFCCYNETSVLNNLRILDKK